jgi:hypothetical protein
MADAGGSPPSITLLQAVLTFSGALLAPVIGTIVALLSRSDLQRRQQEIEYNIKRLDLIDKTITVGKSMSNILGIDIDVSLAQTSYTRVLNSLSEPTPPSEQDLLPFERYRLPMRLLMLPRPTSISGWIASFLFYIYLVSAFISVPAFFFEKSVPPPTSVSPEIIERYYELQIGLLAGSLGIAIVARFWAIRAAKASVRRSRERFQRETDSSHADDLFHKS